MLTTVQQEVLRVLRATSQAMDRANLRFATGRKVTTSRHIRPLVMAGLVERAPNHVLFGKALWRAVDASAPSSRSTTTDEKVKSLTPGERP